MTPYAQSVASFSLNAGLLNSHSRVVVALSGGPDSCALLLALCEAADEGLLPRPIGAAHFHHGLRGRDADDDAAFSAALTSRLQIPCIIGLGQARPEPGQSPNDAARRARYAFLEETAQMWGADCLATAHTRNDQAETILLRVFRGTGIEGLAGIPSIRTLGNGLRVVRPLLEQTRAAGETYCADQGVVPRCDPSNESDRYTRSRLRKRLPELAQSFNPRLDEALFRLGALAARDASLLQSLAEEVWRAASPVRAPGFLRLSVAPLLTAPPALRARVLLRAVRHVSDGAESDEAASADWVEALEALLIDSGTSSRLNLPGGIRAETEGQTLTLKTILPEPTVPPYAVPLPLPGRARIAPAHLWLSARLREPTEKPIRARRSTRIDLVLEREVRGTMDVGSGNEENAPLLLVRNACDGDRIAPLGMGGRTQLVRELMAEARWPEAERRSAPLVVRAADPTNVLWIVGLAQSEATRVDESTAPTAVARLTAEWDC